MYLTILWSNQLLSCSSVRLHLFWKPAKGHGVQLEASSMFFAPVFHMKLLHASLLPVFSLWTNRLISLQEGSVPGPEVVLCRLWLPSLQARYKVSVNWKRLFLFATQLNFPPVFVRRQLGLRCLWVPVQEVWKMCGLQWKDTLVFSIPFYPPDRFLPRFGCLNLPMRTNDGSR